MNRRERTLSPESSRCRRLVPPVDHRSGGNYDNYDDDDDDERIVIAMRGREEEEEEEEDKRSGRTAFRYRATSENRRRRLARLVGRNKSLPRDCDDDDDYRVVGYGYEANDEDGGSGGSSRDGRDSIFSADDNVIGTDEELPTPIAPDASISDVGRSRVEYEDSRMRRRLQEAALLEAMSAPGRCRSRLLAASDHHRDGSWTTKHRSASMPPPRQLQRQRRSSSLGTAFARVLGPLPPTPPPVRTLSKYPSAGGGKGAVSSVEERAAGGCRFGSHRDDCDSGISSVTTADMSDVGYRRIATTGTRDPMPRECRAGTGSLLDSTVAVVLDDDGVGAKGRSDRDGGGSHDATPAVDVIATVDYRSDVLLAGTIDMDDYDDDGGLDEIRQSPEHSQSSFPPTHEREPHGHVAVDADIVLWRTATSSPENFPSGLCHMPSFLDLARSIVPLGNSIIAMSANNDLKATMDGVRCDGRTPKPERSATNSSSPGSNGANDGASPEADCRSGNDIRADEGVECNECMKSETTTVAETDSSDEDVGLLSSKEGTVDDDSLSEEDFMAIDNGSNGSLKKSFGVIHDVMTDGEHDLLYARPNNDRAPTPRTVILEQQGWSHHHRFARHRSILSEPIAIVPLNHVSAAVVVNNGGGGKGGVNGRHSYGMVESSSAKDLVELKFLMDELTELRAWKVHATKLLEDARYGMKEVDKLRASRAEASEKEMALRSECDGWQMEVESRKSRFQNKVAAEQATTESSKEIAALLMSNSELRAENERLSNEGNAMKNRLESTLHSAERQRALVEEEARGLHLMLQADITHLENKLLESKNSNDAQDKELMDLREQIRKGELTLLARDGQICSMKSELASMTLSNSTLQDRINAANVTSSDIDARLKEEIHAHISCQEKLEAATCTNQILQNQIKEQDSVVQTLEDLMRINEIEFQRELEQLKAIQSQLEDDAMQTQDLIHELKASKVQKEEEVILLKVSVKDLSLKGEDLSMRLTEMRDWKSNAEETMDKNSKMIDQLVLQLSRQAGEISNTDAIQLSNIQTLQNVAEAKTDETYKLTQALASVNEKIAAQAIKIRDFQMRSVTDEGIKAELEKNICKREKQLEMYQEQVDLLQEELAILQNSLNLEQESKSKDLAEAALTAEKMQAEIYYLAMKVESDRVQSEKASAEMTELRGQLQASRDLYEFEGAKYQEQVDLLQEELAVLQSSLNLEQESKSKDLAEAALTAEKMQAEIYSLIMKVESGRVQSEKASAEMTELRGQLQASRDLNEFEGAKYQEQVDLLQEELAVLQRSLNLEQESKSKDLAEAALTAEKMQAEIYSLIMKVESGRVQSEKASAEMTELRGQLQASRDLYESEAAKSKYASIQAEFERTINKERMEICKAQADEKLIELNDQLLCEKATAAEHVEMFKVQSILLEEMQTTFAASEEELIDLKNRLLCEQATAMKHMEMFKVQSILLKEIQAKCAASEEELVDIKDRLLCEQATATKHMEMFKVQSILLEEIQAKCAASEEELIDLKNRLLCEQTTAMKQMEMFKVQSILLEEIQVKCAASEEELVDLKDRLLCEQQSKHQDKEAFQWILTTKDHLIQDLEIKMKIISEEILSLQGKLEHNYIQYDREINAANEIIASKSAEVSVLTVYAKRLKDEVQQTTETFNKKLMEERGPRLDENRLLSAALCAKEKEMVQLEDDLKESIAQVRKVQSMFDSQHLLFETKRVEINQLREKIEANDQELEDTNNKIVTLERQFTEQQEASKNKETECERLSQLLEDLKTENAKMTETITHMEQNYETIYRAKLSHIEQESLAIVKEREMMKSDATSKLKVISDLILSHNQILEKMNEISLSREEFEQNIEMSRQEKITSEVLGRRVLQLESDLKHLRLKYKTAKEVIARMEEALMVVVNQRRNSEDINDYEDIRESAKDSMKSGQISLDREEITIEPWGFIEEDIEGESSVDRHSKESSDDGDGTYSLDSTTTR